jgi:hypothetical protein
MRPTAESRKLLAKLAPARGRALTLILLGGGLTAVAAAVSCDQPKPFCIVSPAPFAVRLKEISHNGDCDAFGPAGFNADPQVGVAPYYERDKKGQPDYRRGSIAIQTTEVGNLFATAKGMMVKNTASGGQIYSMGDFAQSEPDADDICSVPKLTKTELKLEELAAIPDDPATADEDESFPGQPAQDITLEWSDVKVVVSAALFGVQLQADLTDTRVGADGQTCTYKYRAMGVSPAVPCYKTDEDGNPVMKDETTYETDPDLCNSEADPENGRFSGSGISPLSDTECDAVTGFCLLRGDTVPAYKE